jgi:hypothetical protein
MKQQRLITLLVLLLLIGMVRLLPAAPYAEEI